MIVKGGPDGSYSRKSPELKLERSEGKTPMMLLFSHRQESLYRRLYIV